MASLSRQRGDFAQGAARANVVANAFHGKQPGDQTMDHTLYEPKEALERNKAYAVVAKADDTLTFPHVDSCLAMVLRLDDDTVLAGHVPQQWAGMPGVAKEQCYKKMLALLEANRKRHGDHKAVHMIAVGPNDWGKLLLPTTQQMGVMSMTVFTKVSGGVDVRVTREAVLVTRCKNKSFQSFDIDTSDFQSFDFND
jgi:hypothetical protein